MSIDFSERTDLELQMIFDSCLLRNNKMFKPIEGFNQLKQHYQYQYGEDWYVMLACDIVTEQTIRIAAYREDCNNKVI